MVVDGRTVQRLSDERERAEELALAAAATGPAARERMNYWSGKAAGLRLALETIEKGYDRGR